MAFFFYQGILVFHSVLGRLRPILQHLLAFGLTCGVVIIWELGESASDRLAGSRFQASIAETMGDQFFGVIGSIVMLVCIASVEHFGRRSDIQSEHAQVE